MRLQGVSCPRVSADLETLCSFADGALVKVGNRTECALLELCGGLGGSYTRIRSRHNLVRRFPFSSDRKRMASLTFCPGERCAPLLAPLTLQQELLATSHALHCSA